MRVKVADSAGFCAGVRNAIKAAEETATRGEKWVTLGPLVHNEEVVNYFKEKGIYPVSNIDEIGPDVDGVIIRAHGISPLVLRELNKKGLKVVDATCTLVARIHKIVDRLKAEGYDIVIFGDETHPEVQGIMGWSNNQGFVLKDELAARDLRPLRKVGIVAQTTKNIEEYLAVVSVLLKKANETRVFNTICPATINRQLAARRICQVVDLMLVIGDNMSSNTSTLFKECLNTGVNTYQIQKASDIKPEWLTGVKMAGVTAGASTPDWIIKEVLDKMAEFEENINQEEQNPVVNEESFAKMEAEMADFSTPARGDIIKGTVIQVLDDEVMVDVGGKSEGIIPLKEISLKDVDSARDIVKVGDEIEVLVLKWDDDGTILLSKKKVDTTKVLDRLEECFKNGEVIEGTVTSTIKGGLLVDVGIVAFLPASHVEYGYVKNLEQYVNKKFKFKIIEFNRNKRRGSQIVLSRKEIIAEEKQKMKEAFWENVEIDQIKVGTVKRIVDYGAFIDLGGYEGLLHVSEIDHRRIEHPSDVLEEGDVIDVCIIGLDPEKERVSLSRKKLLKSPWEIVLEKYREGDIIEGKVARIASFGAFIEIEPGVDGLVHISQLANRRVEKPEDVVTIGQTVKVKILSISHEDKRIGLSIKEAETEAETKEVQEYLDNQED